MFVVLHVAVALSSVAYALYLYIAPTQIKLYTAAVLVMLTLASGTYLVITSHSRLLPACSTGLVYLGIVSAQLLFARRKLARAVATDKIDLKRQP